MRHTIVLSDIHLCEAERERGLWMRYRQPGCSPAPEIAAMLDDVRRRVRGDELCLVLNGDVFDFDAPRVIGQTSVFHDLPRNARHTSEALARILDDHPDFVHALGGVLADGHTVVFVSGNHDVQLTLPEVRALLADRLAAAAMAEGAAGTREEITARVVFRSWFHRTPDGIVVEHGHQYDAYCAYRHPAAPFARDGRSIQPTMGSLVARHLAARMGYFNPHVDGSYELTAIGYLAHWARYYALSHRSLICTWAIGAVRTVVGLLGARLPETRARRRENLAKAARETGTSALAVARHARLFARPVEDRLHLALRVLWLDRAAAGALVAAAAILAIVGAKAALFALFAAPVMLASYEKVAPKEPLDAVWKRVQAAARRVAAIHRARAVVFGHTHHAEASWEGGVFFGNSGSWSAAFRDVECTQPLDDVRRFIWLKSEPGGPLAGGLAEWPRGATARG
jgi:UDP-2,3-diacylglucosamine pyrophosphatase LpxH